LTFAPKGKYQIYLIGFFQNILEETSANNFFRYRSWFETFLYLLFGDGGGAPLKV